jgi:hypothetical protein
MFWGAGGALPSWYIKCWGGVTIEVVELLGGEW